MNKHTVEAPSDRRGPGPAGVGGPPGAMDFGLAAALLRAAGEPLIRIALWDGREVGCPDREPLARLVVHDRAALLKLVTDPEMQFGDLYSAGRLDVEGSILDFLCATVATRPRDGLPRVDRLRSRLRMPRVNSPERSRDNVHHHYDLGNDFYRLWLDEQLLYTCAFFREPDVSLEEAQVAKMDRVARKVWLRPGDRVVEAGCGWGALALHMARNYGVEVDAYNLSTEQIAWARERAAREGLESRVRFIEGDWREIRGEFDAFVSVGMLEHVGANHFRELGAVADRVLRPSGRGLIHTIGQNAPRPMHAWIERRIFPGAYPPTLRDMADIFEPRFSVLDVENLRLHYALTCQHWLDRFDRVAEGRVLETYGPAFVRAWRVYLAGSVSAFRLGNLQLFQVVFSKTANNDVPWTRDAALAGKDAASHA